MLKLATRALLDIIVSNAPGNESYAAIQNFHQHLAGLEEGFLENREAMRACRSVSARNSLRNLDGVTDADYNGSTKAYADGARKIFGVNSVLLIPGASMNIHCYAAVDGEAHEIILADLMQLYHETPKENFDRISEVRAIMQRFIDDATVLRTDAQERRDKRDLLVYDRTIAMLENGASPMFQNYGWIARNGFVATSGSSTPAWQMLDKYDAPAVLTRFF